MHVGGPADQLVDAEARRRQVAGREHDLDVGRQNRRSRDGIVHLGQRAPDGRFGGVDPTLGEAQERQTWLRVAPELGGLQISGFGFGEAAAQPVQLCLLVEG